MNEWIPPINKNFQTVEDFWGLCLNFIKERNQYYSWVTFVLQTKWIQLNNKSSDIKKDLSLKADHLPADTHQRFQIKGLLMRIIKKEK